jgi:nitrate/nitrite transport system substrate-binding protein
VGEPWNQQAVFKGIGVAKAWADKYPTTHVAAVKALIRAGMWLDAKQGANRREAASILSQPNYVGADVAVIANSMTGTFEFEKGDKRPLPDFNVFFRYFATYPFYSDAIWYLTQMRRWGQIAESKPVAWYMETAQRVYWPDIYMQAARELIAEGKAQAADFPMETKGFRGPQGEFIDGVVFDVTTPNDYLQRFAIGLKGNETVQVKQ